MNRPNRDQPSAASPLRVLQIVPSISLVYGGPSQMVRGFSAALGAAGAAVTVLTTDANGDVGQPPLAVPLNQPVPEDGYTIWYFHCSPWRRYKFSLGLLQWLARHSQDYDIAHVHALFSPVSTAAATVARWRGLPYLLRPLGTLDPADLRKKQQLKRLYGYLLERPNLAGAAAVHFTSQPEADVSERFGTHAQEVVIPLGVTPPTTLSPEAVQEMCDRNAIPPDRPRLLYMSRLDPKKGLDLLLPALEQLLRHSIPFHFILCGANPQDPGYEHSIRQWIQHSPLAQRTTITGFVSGDEKAALLQAADVFVLPSYYENFGIAVAEAMMAGNPVVITRGVYIWPDIQQAEAGWLCDGTAESLAQVLTQALGDPLERQRRGQQAQTLANQRYSWDAIAQQTLQIYYQLLYRPHESW
ncbi:Glycosyltransferase Type 1 [Halomicronema hongdechloris C2206]|uniref:Glycosyltransferase Type 1 n=1 Tax=Halomicronema hongdechloris C2206 TaxID=1641165 RepID=A0A1Z3HRH0_9CYAN|nr:Glycosyltransferase Type 1 [Halomicronema hongdechloris C2206]